MKKIFISILALTSIFFTACGNTSDSKKEGENQVEKNNEKLEISENIEVLEVKSVPETLKAERIKSQKEIDFPERFNPTTGESIPEPTSH